MNPRYLPLSLLSFVFLAFPALSKQAQAIPIDNDVIIEWQQDAFRDFAPTLTNGNFVVRSEEELNAALIRVRILRSDLLGGFLLTLNVFDPQAELAPGDFAPILDSGGSQVQLTYGVGEDNDGFDLPGDFPGSSNYSGDLRLSDFQNYGEHSDLLLASLAQGRQLGFSLDASFYGNLGLPINPLCQFPVQPGCPAFSEVGGSASISVSSEPFASTVVPEPATIVTMLTGLAGVAGLRRRRS